MLAGSASRSSGLRSIALITAAFGSTRRYAGRAFASGSPGKRYADACADEGAPYSCTARVYWENSALKYVRILSCKRI